MKGAAHLWFREYLAQCSCVDANPSTEWSREFAEVMPYIDGHVHALPYRHRAHPPGFYITCVSWGRELQVVYDMWMDAGQLKVGVAFPYDKPSSRGWGRLGPPLHDGEWEPYAQPTMAEHLAMSWNSAGLNIRDLLRVNGTALESVGCVWFDPKLEKQQNSVRRHTPLGPYLPEITTENLFKRIEQELKTECPHGFYQRGLCPDCTRAQNTSKRHE